MRLKVGILGGAFNPPHQAHILLGEYAVKYFNLDRLIYIPTHIPAHKDIKDGWDGAIRSLMIKLAVYAVSPEEVLAAVEKISPSNPKTREFIRLYENLYRNNHHNSVSVSDIELESGKMSYTIDTVQKLLGENPGWEIYIIIGMDQAAVLDTWKDYKELARLARFCAADRGGIDRDAVEKKNPGIEFFAFPKMDLSSTMIRSRLKNGRDIRGLVSQVVEEFISLIS